MNTIKLTDFEIALLKRALLCAEVIREKEGALGESENIKELHINIDEQIEKQ